jgi:hypothetical protein
MPYNLRLFFTIAAAGAVLVFGTWWGLKFKYIYLNPWPKDPKLASVFMRMTASDAKPFYACNFIKMNKLKGKMFNYWTEGGFIAYGQQPAPDTGRTPLRLFMDGRAQAAYEPKVYGVWSNIMFGGRIAYQLKQSARLRGQKLTAADYAKIGQWIDKQLKEHEVWAVLMPSNQFDTPFVRGLEHNPDWLVAFLNNKQKLFVDKATPQGEELLAGIDSGQTLYPDDFSKNLILAHNLLLPGKGKADHKRGLDFAIKAFKLNQSQAPMREIMSARRFRELIPEVGKFCKVYLDEFTENENRWAKQDGYHHRLIAAVWAANHLRRITEMQKKEKIAEHYAAKRRKYDKEIKWLVKTKKW